MEDFTVLPKFMKNIGKQRFVSATLDTGGFLRKKPPIPKIPLLCQKTMFSAVRN